MNKKFLCAFVSLGMRCFGLPNLEAEPQDFVLEIQKIDIPGFPYAFNPSMVRYNGQILMSFRVGSYFNDSGLCEGGVECQIPANRVTGEVGLIWLNEDFQPQSAPQLLKIPCEDETIPFRPQDPRLLFVGDTLYMTYNNFVKIEEVLTQRMFFAALLFDGEKFELDTPEAMKHFDHMVLRKTEKNWTPFDYEKNLYFSYSFAPHRVFQPRGEDSCDLVAITQKSPTWPWGEMRGGSPALKFGNQYLGFFHSCKAMKTEQSQGHNRVHYFMGAYTFSAMPPFPITAISERPLVSVGFYSGESYTTWKPLHVVFPSGYIFDDRFIWIAYGRQDHEIWIAKLAIDGLVQSLVPLGEE